MNWRLPSQKILFTAAVDDTIPTGHQNNIGTHFTLPYQRQSKQN